MEAASVRAVGPLDAERLAMAHQAAQAAVGVSDPNPRVGCIIGRQDGTVLGVGSTQRAGDAHAEVMALRQAQASEPDLRGATAWVTLEPCSHHGRTPPCCDALVRAGIARVVVGERDPNPLVAGQGLQALRAAGITVEMGSAEDALATRELNIGFFSRHERGRPWVRLKVAASLDGRTALDDGRSQWITGEAARADGHAWRRRAGAIVTGIGTVLADDPRLDVRLVPTALQPLRVVVDSTGRLPLGARLLAPPGRAWVATADAHNSRCAALQQAGAEVHAYPEGQGRVDLEALIAELGRLGHNEIHVEAGAALNGALLEQGLVDEMLLYLAPMLVGAGRGIAQLAPLTSLPEAMCFETVDMARLGDDWRLRLRPAIGSRGLRARQQT